MICKRCGFDIPEGIKFCTNCGAPMEISEVSPVMAGAMSEPMNGPVMAGAAGEPMNGLVMSEQTAPSDPNVFEPLPGDEELEEVFAPKRKEKAMAIRYLYGLILGLCLHEISMIFMDHSMGWYGMTFNALSVDYVAADRLLRVAVYLILGTMAILIGKTKKKAGPIILLILSVLMIGGFAALAPQSVWVVDGNADILEKVPVLGLIIGMGSATLVAFLIGLLGKPRKIWVYLIIMVGCFLLMAGFVFVWSFVTGLETDARAQGLLIEWVSMDFFATLAMPAIGLAGGWIKQVKLGTEE